MMLLRKEAVWMENIIEKLTEIEAVASKTMESVAGRKQELMKEMADRRQAFDVQVENESHIYLENLQKQLTIQKEEELKELRKNTEQQVQQMQRYYRENHSRLADELFRKIVRMWPKYGNFTFL